MFKLNKPTILKNKSTHRTVPYDSKKEKKKRPEPRSGLRVYKIKHFVTVRSEPHRTA